MKRVKLGEICEVVSGSTPKTNIAEYWDGDLEWITPAELDDETYIIKESHRKITRAAVQKTSLKPFPKGTVILSSRAPIGKVAIAGKEMYCNQGFKNLICSESVDNRYLYWYLKGHTDYLNALGRGATFKELSKNIVENIEIPLPELDKQIMYSNILKKCCDIMMALKQQMTQYELLIKSRFVELFGDPSINPKGWNEVNISEITSGKVSNGFFAKRSDYIKDGNVSVLGVANVVNRMYSQCKNLPKAYGTKSDIKKFQVQYGDLLFCRSSLVAEGIGKASVVPVDVPKGVLFECHVIRLVLDLEKCVPEYIQMLTTTDYYRKQILAQSKTATMTTIGQDGILKTNVLLPPVELQKQFLHVVQQTEKLKSITQKSINELQLLFDSLMQKYFG